MAESKIQYSSGISFLGMLTILFIGLKLTGHITWSWFWVLSPLFAIPAILIILLGVFLSVGLGALLVASCLKKKEDERKDELTKAHEVLNNLKPDEQKS